MEQTQGRKYWFMYSLTDVVFVTTLFIVLGQGAFLLRGADTAFHLKVGEYIVEHQSVPAHDVFTSVVPAPGWTPPTWLADVLFALMDRGLGLAGVVILMAIVIAATTAVLFAFLRRVGTSVLAAGLVTAIALVTSMVHWLARPHILATFLFLLWYVVLELYRRRRSRSLVVLPMLMLVWVNVHGSFVLGFVLGGIYLAGWWFGAGSQESERRDRNTKTRVLAAALGLSLVACLLNPQGFKILTLPFHTANNSIVTDFINEWKSPDFHDYLPYEGLLLLMIALFARYTKRLDAIDVMLVLLFTHMSLYSARFIPLFALIVSPIVAQALDASLGRLKEKRILKGLISTLDGMSKVDAQTRPGIWATLAAVVLIVVGVTGTLQYEFDRSEMPIDAMEFLKQEDIGGQPFNSDVFGSYMIYALWPQYEPFIDGRYLQGQERMEEYLNVISIKRDWRDVLDKHNITWVFYKNESALSNILIASGDWALIYSDAVANVFVKDTPVNQHVISKYPHVTRAVVSEDGSS